MNRNKICPSGCDHRAPATMNARPAALSITSIDIKTKMMFRRTRTPVVPSAKRMLASMNPSRIIQIGTDERKGRRIEHHFDRHQDKDDVSPDEDSRRPEREKNARQYESVANH